MVLEGIKQFYNDHKMSVYITAGNAADLAFMVYTNTIGIPEGIPLFGFFSLLMSAGTVYVFKDENKVLDSFVVGNLPEINRRQEKGEILEDILSDLSIDRKRFDRITGENN